MIALPRDLRDRLRAGGDGLTIVAVRLGAFGDILRTLPAVRLVGRSAPAARMVWVADDRWSGFLNGHPDLDRIVPFPRKITDRWRAGPRTWPKVAGSLADFFGELRRTTLASPGAIVLDFHGNLRSGLIGRASGAPVRLGFSGHQQKEGNRLWTTHRVTVGARRESRVERNLRLVAALGFDTAALPDGGLAISESEATRAERVVGETLGARRDYAVLSPGASAAQAFKKPPTHLLAAAARELAARGLGSVVVWGPGEQDDARAVVAAAGGAANLAPATDLRTLAALLRAARLFVGGDTGPLHLACAVSCPVVGIYGPTDPAVNAPWGVPHTVVAPPGRSYTGIPRIDRSAGGFDGIESGEVHRAIERVLTAASTPT